MRNWCGLVEFHASEVREPASLSELQATVAGATRIRALGTGHSFNDLADTDGVHVSVAKLPTDLEVDSDLGIARAIVGDPPILVLDEPTSMMDNQTEQQIIAALKDYSKDKTVIVITHRTSLLSMVDRVIVLDGGRVIADGPKSILNTPPAQPAAVQPGAVQPRAVAVQGGAHV